MDRSRDFIKWPEESGEYKMIQVVVDGKPGIYFGDLNTSLHCIILENLLVQHNITFTRIEVKERIKVPTLKGDRYEVVGMGKVSVDLTDKTMHFGGESFHYGLTPGRAHLKGMKELHPEWTFEMM